MDVNSVNTAGQETGDKEQQQQQGEDLRLRMEMKRLSSHRAMDVNNVNTAGEGIQTAAAAAAG
jgi:hypothetical protein